MKKLIAMTALGAALFAGGLAVAQPGPGSDGPARGWMGAIGKDGTVTKAALTAELEKRFAALDTDKDGKITPEERKAAMEKRFDERFAKMDTDGNGQLSKDELKAARAAHDGPKGRFGRGKGWHGGPMGGMGGGPRGDADRDGTVTRAEFLARPLAMFDRLDVDKDGTVTAQERQAAMASFRKGPGMRHHGPAGEMPPPPPPAN